MQNARFKLIPHPLYLPYIATTDIFIYETEWIHKGHKFADKKDIWTVIS